MGPETTFTTNARVYWLPDRRPTGDPQGSDLEDAFEITGMVNLGGFVPSTGAEDPVLFPRVASYVATVTVTPRGRRWIARVVRRVKRAVNAAQGSPSVVHLVKPSHRRHYGRG